MRLSSWLPRRVRLTLPVVAMVNISVFADVASVPADSVPVHELGELEVLDNAPRRTATAAVPVYTLTSGAMEAMGVTDISDALHRLPGVNLRDYGGAGGLKTVSVRGLGANHTAVVLDGLPVVDCQNGFVDMSRFTPDNMESLSLAVGDDNDIFVSAQTAASAATVSMSTAGLPLPDSRATALRMRVRGGSFGMVNPFFQVARGFGNGWAAVLDADYRHADNDYPFRMVNGSTVTDGRRINSGMNVTRCDATIRRLGGDGSSVTAKVYAYWNHRRLPGSVTLYNPESHERLQERNFFGQARWIGADGGKLRWQAAAKFSWDASRYRDTDLRYPGGELDDNYIQRHAYVTASLLYRPAPGWSVDWSADYSYGNLTSNRAQPQPSRHSFLAMAAAKYSADAVIVSARLLASVYANRARRGEAAADARRLSPSASVSIRPWSGQLFFVRASYKNIFRMPTFADSYYGTTGSPVLRPETADQFNLGVTWQAGRSAVVPLAVFTADAYCNFVKDRIVALPRNMFVWSMVNVGKVRAVGLDLTAAVSVALAARQSLLLSANYSYQRVQPRTSPDDPDYNRQVAYTPVHSGCASLTYENPWANVVVHATAVSERYGTNSNLPVSRIDGYADFGAGFYRTFRLGRYRLLLRADMTNIFNCQYQVIARYPMPGRAWQLTVTFDV